MRNLVVTGFDVRSFYDEFPAAREALQQITPLEMRIETLTGLDQLPLALRKILRREARGKLVLRVTPEPRL